jgi:hypothetical protein
MVQTIAMTGSICFSAPAEPPTWLIVFSTWLALMLAYKTKPPGNPCSLAVWNGLFRKPSWECVLRSSNCTQVA